MKKKKKVRTTNRRYTKSCSFEAIVLVCRLLQDLGVPISWSDEDIPLACYLPATNEILFNQKAFEKGNAAVDINVQQFAHCLFHEMGHALWSKWGRRGTSNTTDFVEEIWCDNFAADMCAHLGLKWPKSQGSPYKRDLAMFLKHFV